MRRKSVDRQAGIQPPLVPLEAYAVSLQALVDHETQDVLFVVETVDPVENRLVALWSTAPYPLDKYLRGLHKAHKEFLKQLWDACGPFA